MPIDEIELRYIIIHSDENLKKRLEKIFGHIASTSYNTEDITSNFQLNTISKKLENSSVLSIAEIRVLDMPYESIREFEESILDVGAISEVCKTYDSSKLEENQEFLAELYNIEMKIREIYTLISRLQGANLKHSRVKLTRDYQNGEDVLERRLINEFFFVTFSDYKNVDRRKETKLENLLDSLREVERVKDIRNAMVELSHPTLHLAEGFNELSRIPEAIGRLEKFRNNIAHNRYNTETDIENFKKAKSIVDDVHNSFITRLKGEEK